MPGRVGPGMRLAHTVLKPVPAPTRPDEAVQLCRPIADAAEDAISASVELRFVAVATARRAITPIRWARYAASAWISLFKPSAGAVSPSSDLAENRLPSASSAAVQRKTPFEPAPVTATRISLARLATNTPTRA